MQDSQRTLTTSLDQDMSEPKVKTDEGDWQTTISSNERQVMITTTGENINSGGVAAGSFFGEEDMEIMQG